jgi:hypothetical protein
MNVEDHPVLRWPETRWQRTLIRDRRTNPAWKKPLSHYKQSVVSELRRLGATNAVFTYNVPPGDRQDPGVAIWFSKLPRDDFSWQAALGLNSPAPRLDEINAAYRRLAAKCHPDGETPNVALYIELGKHKTNAANWVTGKDQHRNELVVPCDRYVEVRLNLAAIASALRAFRTLDRVGVPGLLDAALSGLTALPPHTAVGEGEHVPATP